MTSSASFLVLLMKNFVVQLFLKSASGTHKFTSILDRMSMELHSVLLSILLTFKLIKTGLLARLPATLLILTDCFLPFWPTCERGFSSRKGSSQVAPFP